MLAKLMELEIISIGSMTKVYTDCMHNACMRTHKAVPSIRGELNSALTDRATALLLFASLTSPAHQP